MKYREYNDFELISYIKEQNEEANEIMYSKYRPLVIKMAKKLYKNNAGIDINDLINEGMLGVFNAILNYRENLNVPFYSYVKMCIENNMFSFLKGNIILRNKVLNESISYDNTDDECNIEDFIGTSENTLGNLINIENIEELKSYMQNILTKLEYKVFIYKLEGYDSNDIAHILRKEKKNIDNALYRIKKKIKDKSKTKNTN